MKIAAITYDLKNVKEGDNSKVKNALLEFVNTHSGLKGIDWGAKKPVIISLSFPDTTLTAEVNEMETTPEILANQVAQLIIEQEADPDKIYVTFIDKEYLWNSNPKVTK